MNIHREREKLPAIWGTSPIMGDFYFSKPVFLCLIFHNKLVSLL